MAVITYNNWRGSEEFKFIELELKRFHEPEQIGVAMALMGFGMVIVWNSNL